MSSVTTDSWGRFQGKITLFVKKRDELYSVLSDIFGVDLKAGRSGDRKELIPALQSLIESNNSLSYSARFSEPAVKERIQEVLSLRDDILQDQEMKKLLRKIYRYGFVVRGNDWINFDDFYSVAIQSLFSVLDRLDGTGSITSYLSRWVVTDVMREFGISSTTKIHLHFFDDLSKDDSTPYIDTISDPESGSVEDVMSERIDMERIINIALSEFGLKPGEIEMMSYDQKIQKFREKWMEMEKKGTRGMREIEYLVQKLKRLFNS
jgi:hypothetical protein